ncbi:MAG TPA: hypothetical protein VKC17_02380 [Sphingomicrobium sp.]|jgi:hypothetical protein|nr:hypothetical protein [Sphingomicrobium sp.]
MRALILVAGAALAVSACSSNDAANNTMNVDENLTAPADMNATDMNATDMNATDMNATNATDANATAADANATADTSTNNAQ